MGELKVGDRGYNPVLGILEIIGFNQTRGLILARTPNSASRGEVHAVEPTRFRRLA